MSYDKTEVSVESSQSSIRKLLVRYGATRMTFSEGTGEEDGRRWVVMEFVHSGTGRAHLVRMAVPLKEPDDTVLRRKAQRARTRTLADLRNEAFEQEGRRIWRVLFYNLKARMESVEEEVETFEQAWLPHIVDPYTNVTLWDRVRPAVEAGRLAIGGAGLQLTDGEVSATTNRP